MERQQYLDYFNNNKKKPSSKNIYNPNSITNQSRSLHLNGSRTDKKILPHISEEYEYKITNQLLVNKIMHPKRDKLIIESFHKSPSRPGTRQGHSRGQTIIYEKRLPQSLDVRRRQDQEIPPVHNSFHQRIDSRQNTSKFRHKTIKSHEKDFQLALQNQRMGRRIIKTKSSVEEILKKTFYTYKGNNKSNQFDKENHQTDLKNSYIQVKGNNKIYFSGKINNGVKVFFNPIHDQQKQLSQTRSLNQSKTSERSSSTKERNQNQKEKYQKFKTSFGNQLRKTKTTTNLKIRSVKSRQNQLNNSKHVETHHPESFKIFGKGPTILMIYNMEITCNPPLKQESILILELITHEKRITIRKNKQKSIRTSPIAYEFIKPTDCGSSNCIRFGVNVSQIGDFVPLRIYKVNGVEIQQLGIIDVDLAAFRYRKSELNEQSNGTMVKQFKLGKNGERMERDIIFGDSQGKLRKNLLNKTVQTHVTLSYKVYSKKYQPVDYENK